jgi:hypothetical protein
MTVHLHRTDRGARPVPFASVQGTLALDYGARVRSTPGPDLRLVPGNRAELEAFAHRFASAVVEVVGGDRGPSQLLRWTSERVYAELQRRCVHVFCPSPEAAEISVHVRRGERSSALAARIELLDGRWCCTALEFG